MQYQDFQVITDFVRSLYGQSFVPLHRPVFEGNERQYLTDCIDSNFVSSVGVKVDEFEQKIAEFTGSGYAIATVNGTAALHISLLLAGVMPDDEVITQSLTFVATGNSILYAGAHPVFLDVDIDTMGLSADALEHFLNNNIEMKNGAAINKSSGRRIAACMPAHIFGMPCNIEKIVELCRHFGIQVIEDAAESLGSFVEGQHTGTFGTFGAFSFNGNKIITSGGGGMIVTNDQEMAKRAKHLTTTAKQPHPYEYVHDEVGYNYRMPNLNAALGCAQMERLSEHLQIKAEIARQYDEFFNTQKWQFVKNMPGTIVNHWLNAIIMDSKEERDAFLEFSNKAGVMTRPIWKLINTLPMFSHFQSDGLTHSRWLEDRIVNLPSSVPDGALP